MPANRFGVRAPHVENGRARDRGGAQKEAAAAEPGGRPGGGGRAGHREPPGSDGEPTRRPYYSVHKGESTSLPAGDSIEGEPIRIRGPGCRSRLEPERNRLTRTDRRVPVVIPDGHRPAVLRQLAVPQVGDPLVAAEPPLHRPSEHRPAAAVDQRDRRDESLLPRRTPDERHPAGG